MMASSSSFGMSGDNSNTGMGMNLNMHVNTGTNPVCEAAISAGRQHYAARRYKPALEQFTRVCRSSGGDAFCQLSRKHEDAEDEEEDDEEEEV